ncbi:hypothetical protein STHU_05920 [Allostella humosa]|nr:2'-5' RNA ligase family protein [Stella humosa]BBK29958.1 hypothetical protein STHU_05920 [Stella humosa]
MLAVIGRPVVRGLAGRRIERLRARFDPRARIVPTHVTVAFPKAGVAMDAGLARLRQAASATPGAIRGTLGHAHALRTPGPRGWYVLMPLAAGGRRLARLHHRLSRPPLDGNRRGTAPYHPHVTVAAGLDAAGARRVRRLAAGLAGTPLTIDALSLVAWDGRRLDVRATVRLGISCR